MKTLRLELLIATLALLASAAASIATVVQTGAVEKQLSASVWPYLTVENTFSPGAYRLDVINQGLGPAIVRTVSLTVGGKTQARWRDALRTLVALDPHAKRGTPQRIAEHDFGTGSVIRAGQDTAIIDIRSALVDDFRQDDAPKIDLAVCYCSILQQCWTVDGGGQDQPKAVHDCGNAANEIAL